MAAASSSIKYSFSEWLQNEVPKHEESDPFFVSAGKAVAVIMTTPIALIEAAVRGVFAVVATPLALLLPPSDLREWYQEHIFSPLALGSTKSLEAFLTGLVIGPYLLTKFTIIDPLKNLISADDGKTARTPPSIWCCCTKQEFKELEG
jgi:hypothetical protein